METVNQEATTETEKTFTQDDVNAIVGERLAREREKFADYELLKEKASKFDEAEEASKSELQKATERAEKLESELKTMKKAEELRTIREKVSAETGVPASLLTAETEEGCTEQAKGILAFKGEVTYPTLPDGGEVQGAPKGTTKQQFAEWANKAFNN
jgi:hypothetical protein